MATLPGRLNSARKLSESRRATFPSFPKQTECVPKSLKDTEFHAYFCQDALDAVFTTNLIESLEERGYVCGEYNRDFLIGEKILDLISHFIFCSKKIVIILSEHALSSRMAMYQLHLAVRYCIDHDTSNIVALHLDNCDMPAPLLPFTVITVLDNKNWTKQLIDFLDKPAHVSLDEVCKTVRSVMSDPPTLKAARGPLHIPDNVRLQIKIWHRSRSIDESQKRLSLEKLQIDSTDGIPRTSSSKVDEGTRSLVYTPDSMNNQLASMAHAVKMRVERKRVYEARESRIGKNEAELTVHAGDVLELLNDNPTHGSLYECENSLGKRGLVPWGLLTPSWHLIPSNIVKHIHQPISQDENDKFRDELKLLGHSFYTVVNTSSKDRHDTMQLSIERGDVLFKQSPQQGGRAAFRNCRNCTGYVKMGNVEFNEVASPRDPKPSRSSDTSIDEDISSTSIV